MSDQAVTSGQAAAVGLQMTETDDAHHTVVVDSEQPNAHVIVIGNQQPSTVQIDPVEASVFEEDSIEDIECLDMKISQSEVAYSKIVGSILKFISLYAIMQAAILEAVFSSQQSNCKGSWGLLAVSAIVSAGVIVALLREFLEQFRLLRRGRLLIEKRNSLVDRCIQDGIRLRSISHRGLQDGIRLSSISRSSASGITVSDAKEDDLGINSNYWRWTAERVVFVLTLIAFSICLWRSCKSRLLCQPQDLPSTST